MDTRRKRRADRGVHSKEGGRKRSSNQRSRERDPNFLCSETQRTPFIPPFPSFSAHRPREFIMFLARRRRAARASRPPNSLALWPLSPLCLPELCNFRDHTEDALRDDDDDVASGLYSRRRRREDRRGTRLAPHFEPKSRVDDDEHNGDDMHADGRRAVKKRGRCMHEGPCKHGMGA